MYELSGKTALVTGAGRGIGQATALRLAREGANVAVVDVNAETALATKAGVEAVGVRGWSLAADLETVDGVASVGEFCRANRIDVDILVNNAGISRYKSILDSTVKDWDEHVNIMARATFLLMKEFAPAMMERGWGRIVNLGSYVAQFNCVTKNFGPYVAAKFAIVGLTQVAAQEFAPHVTVNAIGPGDVATDMMELEWVQEGERRNLSAAAVKEEYRRRLLLQRFETPEDIAAGIAHLASDEASQITGAHHIVGGGLPYKAVP
ncbi:MAG: SDR family oxidoreductase [Bifidobacteriaceae bacterium]|jgi:NAD(P)-dependent dehydrogenase (short-subunit alcohol dehydrogenase family)|nr:SDR family oxidoreductase [Bifidobacteriaceae bacterium]